ncbi:MAG: ATPase, partial [Alphaproteobacteria bacterium]|nr:ATPase [Alphaproteobacteria bacterium]
MRTAKRFYKDVGVRNRADGFEVILDGLGIKTPLAFPLLLPTKALADAVAGEWSRQKKVIIPAAMPLTQLANTVVDRVRLGREDFCARLADFGKSDLICHRAEGPEDLVRRQEREWTPLLDWAAERYGAHLETGRGVMPVEQSVQATKSLSDAVRSLGDWILAPTGAVASATGSLILALALTEGRISPDEVFSKALLDELWQAERWGEDSEAAKRRADIA